MLGHRQQFVHFHLILLQRLGSEAHLCDDEDARKKWNKKKTEKNAQKKPTCLGSPADDDGGEMCGMQALGNMSYAAQIIEMLASVEISVEADERLKDREMCSKQDLNRLKMRDGCDDAEERRKRART